MIKRPGPSRGVCCRWNSTPISSGRPLRISGPRPMCIPFSQQYLAADGSSHRGGRGTDANAGVEFKITRALNLWFQMNNIFNNKYQRWNQYQVYGFNVLGGIVFSFGGK